MNSRFRCPSCSQRLIKEIIPKNAPSPYVQLYCSSLCCREKAANLEGGSGPDEESAYRSLCAAIDNETTEQECEPWEGESETDRKERIKDQIAERLNDMERSGGP